MSWDPSVVLSVTVKNFAVFNPPERMVTPAGRKKRYQWIRWQVNAHRDPDILDLPHSERAIFPALCGVVADKAGGGTLRMTLSAIARELDYPIEHIEHALEHLSERGRVTVKCP